MSENKRPVRRPSRRRPASSGDSRRAFALLGLLCLAAALVGIGLVAIVGWPEAHSGANAPAGTQALSPGDGTSASDGGTARVTFVAVGDNLPDDEIGAYADACAGTPDDGAFDYRPLYEHIKPYVEQADLAYMKEETHLGGDDIGPKGYPSFNTTDAMADAVVDAGFDLVGSATNHSYDWGYFGALDHSCALWAQQPIAFAGTAASSEDAERLCLVEKNGITFALLDYTYGVNGYEEGELPAFAVNFMHEERIRADVARAQEVADAVIVAMHWGTENQTEPDENQLAYAQLLADLDVDLVLGSHPHVIGPLAWVEGASGHRTLVAYSLGNFLSNHEAPDALNELEGMLACTFVKDEAGVRIEDPSWMPLVNHSEEEGHAVYAVKDYTPELAAKHPCLSQLDDPIAWLGETSREIVGDFPVDA